MVDMAQADRTLRQQQNRQYAVCWTVALSQAAKEMGFSHYVDVPDGAVETLKISARRIQIAGTA